MTNTTLTRLHFDGDDIIINSINYISENWLFFKWIDNSISEETWKTLGIYENHFLDFCEHDNEDDYEDDYEEGCEDDNEDDDNEDRSEDE